MGEIDVSEEAIERIRAMGLECSEDEIKEALEQCNNNLEVCICIYCIV